MKNGWQKQDVPFFILHCVRSSFFIFRFPATDLVPPVANAPGSPCRSILTPQGRKLTLTTCNKRSVPTLAIIPALGQEHPSMNADRSLEASTWEKFTDGVNALSEGVVGFLGRLFGSSNDRMVRSLGYIRGREGSHTITPNSLLDQVNSLEEAMRELSDEQLKNKTVEFRERLANGETLDDILPEAFAACREAARRTKDMRHFDVQIIGGIILHRG